MERKYFVIFTIVTMLVLAAIFILVINIYPVQREIVHTDAETLEQAIRLSEQRILDSYQYQEYGGGELQLLSINTNKCNMC